MQLALFSELVDKRVLIGREEAAELLNLSISGFIGRTHVKGFRPTPIPIRSASGRRIIKVVYDLEEVMEVKRVMEWMRGRER